MARKQVIVNEEMIRGIMAGDIPNYAKTAGLYRYRQLPVHTEVFIDCSPKSQHVEIH